MTTATELRDWAWTAIDGLTQLPGKSKIGIYRKIAETSGLNWTVIKAFHTGGRPHPRCNTLDKMIEGIRKVYSEGDFN